ncbi:uncharacterized protein LOC120627043 [Pararge aegeria]|uniref:Jg20310 protein n=1 Tax=Pararge aegeria aegeria TaxID=348720 RepID=A0A8S4SE20_9NEOP|nr:uncharacterized protein LOC120627043 [Pararge aegeria]CAH2267412.1 jg20310 [Pararge aegeria aegeria]
MTKEEEEQQCDPCVTAVLALSLVSQVLDEAFLIANAAKDSGQPWQYVSSWKKLRSFHFNELYNEDMTITTVSNGDTQYVNDNHLDIENQLDTIATSTPQKSSDYVVKSINESNVIIGQGDEDFDVSNTELRKSTSMIINHLFDMSDVEHVNISEEYVAKPTNESSDNSDVLITNMTKIMDSYVNNAQNVEMAQWDQEDNDQPNYCESSDMTDKSSYSVLSDIADISKNVCFNTCDEIVTEKTIHEELAEIDNETKKYDDEVAFYENAYLTLNRDYEHYSEDDEPILQDPKTLPMQEVELLAANTSSENIEPSRVKKKLATVAMPTSVAGSQKSSLVHRCRIQGARLLSCFRGWWWRRKMPGRRKVPRAPGSIRGIYPLSPDARRRAASLLDHRHLRTPSPSSSLVWKFNTVNEALVHSSRWKEFDLKMSLNENDEL